MYECLVELFYYLRYVRQKADRTVIFRKQNILPGFQNGYDFGVLTAVWVVLEVINRVDDSAKFLYSFGRNRLQSDIGSSIRT